MPVTKSITAQWKEENHMRKSIETLQHSKKGNIPFSTLDKLRRVVLPIGLFDIAFADEVGVAADFDNLQELCVLGVMAYTLGY